jgi:transposase
VLHSFGKVDETLLANLRAAFRGAKSGQKLGPISGSVLSSHITRPSAALQFLDIAVVLEIWNQLKLGELIDGLAQDNSPEIPDHKVIAALVAQRCVAPDSKLSATRWFPTTALPELLAIAPEQFNNTRLHRALERLETMTEPLMRTMASRSAEVTGGFATLYLDITDTWFEGRGPEMAAYAKTKEGMVRSKIGLVLLCDEHGYPLRWEVLQGRYAEAPAMLDMLRQLRHVPWAASAPVVMDRAMGRTAYIEELNKTGLRFITAVAAPEMQTYFPQLDQLTKPLEMLELTTEGQLHSVQQSAHERIANGGMMKQVNDTLWVLDAGESELPSTLQSVPVTPTQDAPAEALRVALEATEAVNSGRCASFADAFRMLRLNPQEVRNLRPLAQLPQDMQQRILNGEAAGLSAFRFARMARLRDEQEQRAAFEAALSKNRPHVAVADQNQAQLTATPSQQNAARVRVVVSFNPEVFASQRLTAYRHLEAIRQNVAELNAQLSSGRCRMTKEGIARRVDELLRNKDLLTAFQVKISLCSDEGKERYHVELVLDEANWRQRRRSDGFSVLVAQKDIAASAERICSLYRAKDAVETDFRVIKSQLQLRPVHHRTDAKVRAHVTLCMLALLVERTLRQQLTKAGSSSTAERALQILEPIRLCHFPAANGKDTYLPTLPSDDQARLLRRLKLSRLVDPAQLATLLTPRPPVVPTKKSESA